MSSARPRTSETVRDITEKILKLSEHGYQLNSADDLWRAGMTSLRSLGLMLAIEDAFGIEFPEDMLNKRTFSSVDSIAAAVDSVRRGS